MDVDDVDDVDDGQALARAEALADWWDQWQRAWDALAAQGACDAVGSREYRRVMARALFRSVPANQVDLRQFIRRECNLPAPTYRAYRRTLGGCQVRQQNGEEG